VHTSPAVKYYIGDVRSEASLSEALCGVDYVFHAAALKQVPSCEFYPVEAIKTNTLGADNVITAAINNHVERVIVLSTDKAVQPINAMGMSKALMEKVMVARSNAANHRGTILCGTRYGNVMGSRGSVIPLFIDQLKAGKPLTVTDPKMTRFMMSIDDAVDLVVYAFNNGKPGDIFVQKSPAATIGDLAEAVRILFNSKVPIQNIGTRQGEKTYETLLSRDERSRAEDQGEYFRVRSDIGDLNYKKFFFEGSTNLEVFEDYSSNNTRQLTIPEITKMLSKLDFVQEALRS
jgi:UDP-glucose 4-epimerase